MSLYNIWEQQLREVFPTSDFSPKDTVKLRSTKVSLLVQGDLVCVPSDGHYPDSLPWHFGVSAGNLQILDLVRGRQPEVAIIDIDDFLGDSNYIFVIPQNHNEPHLQRQSSYNRALFLQAFINNSPEPVYHPTAFNCRHFATMCCTGRYDDDLDTISLPAEAARECYNAGDGLCGKAREIRLRDRPGLSAEQLRELYAQFMSSGSGM